MILKYPYATEKASMIVERDGQLQFIVDRNASKGQIKVAIEKMFDQPVTRVRTLMNNRGEKKAMVSFSNPKAAEEILSRLGIM
ncbi:50S ribosomal protein L23 [Methanospirillum hungatei]|jgi:large subunit ribosomal protein L23|uniref:50S ribosomal protein L23 n=1 Tax=Methanospirillum hungatei TaxID=2203 RepID=UPI0009C5A476|nr:50S ribosomal protein L23 [Methanospirillum hungatei]MBP7034176.1 50S ribosomal protein L23 [Methanospirillum sp.]OQA56938.1 MAG: 50S ribosomal protein L23P [Euryarchaeota archaeon ADurb.Bin294]HOB72233.1 50S ribosomal protein L23 [bacterium]MBP9007060.1 50S ribosomal protein L23 [Methanospirillum sp.]HOW03690.1 50S ribosomal protein L23 [Methanospirillum hungatei]